MQASSFSSCRRPAGLAAAVFLGLALTSCDGSTGPEMGRLDVILGQVGSGLAARVSAPGALAALGSQLGVPLDQVSEINMTVTSIQVHRVGADDEDVADGSDGTEGSDGTDGDGSEGPWITVDLTDGGATDGIAINLLKGKAAGRIASPGMPHDVGALDIHNPQEIVGVPDRRPDDVVRVALRAIRMPLSYLVDGVNVEGLCEPIEVQPPIFGVGASANRPTVNQ